MYPTVLGYLEETAEKYADKTAYSDNDDTYSFGQLVEFSKRIGSAVIKKCDRNNPVVVFMDKGAHNLPAFFGVVYAGCFYVPIDSQMPVDRISLIIDTLQPKLIICDNVTEEKTSDIANGIPSIHYMDAIKGEIFESGLKNIRERSKSTDLLYVLFTSGSTGIPKGVTISHGAVMDFMEWICETYSLDENTVLCNQAPFYFDASVPDIYIPLKTGASVYIPPKTYYTFPKKVLQYIEKNKVNTLVWVPSALCNVVNCKAFEVCVPKTVELVIFCGEVMPCKHLNVWKYYVPNALYVNMYGPTEATYACMYYNINRKFADDEKLPLGKACENSEVILLDSDDKIVSDGNIGEICVLGQCLSQGYYNDPERTHEVFVQNPANRKWLENMYRTGDLAQKNDNGELIFVGRKDHQIKRLGYRIELGEIENVVMSVEMVESVCCVYDEEKSEIIVLYTGKVDIEKMINIVSEKLTDYMMPNRFIQLEKMPLNLNGKIDRTVIKKNVMEGMY